ncbi:low density lipoprotein receptor-related protein 11 [Cricetulus griseus]
MAARGGPGPGSRHRALCGLFLLCLWLPSGRPGEPAAPPSGVDRLLQDFRRQLQRARPREELEPELLGGPREDCPGAGGTAVYRAVPDTIIRTQDSIAAGASFLRAPGTVRGWRQCVAACCSEPRCTVAVVQLPRGPSSPSPMPAPRCYLFNCTARGRSVCKFAPLRGYRTYTLSRTGDTVGVSPGPGEDEPPLSKAGKDVVLHLPTDGVILDGRESTDDHAIVHYEWTLKQGDPSVDMKVPQPGTLKLSHLKEGVYIFQLTVTDTVGQRSSDNVSVSVLPRTYSMGGCSSVCSRYHFFCDNGCCIDITLACDGVRQCPDGSDEDFCQNCAVLPLALGLAITALLLLMVTCRLRLVKQKLKKARPITSEESDYLINGMYL